MKTAITMGIIIGLLSPLFVLIIYLVFALISTLFRNIGKDEFKWYGTPLDHSYAKTQCFDSFGEMFKFGLRMSLKMGALMFVMSVLVCIFVELKG